MSIQSSAAPGGAQVFDLASPTPAVPVARLSSPTPAPYEAFGSAVAIEGPRVVVGAPQESDGASYSGRVHVFDLASANPESPIATLEHPAPNVQNYLGTTVALSGEYVLAGAPYDPGSPNAGGQVFLYDLSTQQPARPIARLISPDPIADEQFGGAVAMAGGLAVIGGSDVSGGIWDRGAAYVFGPNPRDTDGDGLLDNWEIGYFGALAGQSAFDDSDGDGREELVEFALGGDPLVPDAASAPALTAEGGFLTLSIAKRAGVSFAIESSATPGSAGFSTATTTVLLDNATTLKARDNFPIGGGGGRFLRVKVTAAP